MPLELAVPPVSSPISSPLCAPESVAPESAASSGVTFEEYLECTGDSYAEWIDGQVIYLTATLPHQELVIFLTTLFTFYVEEYDLGQVVAGPYPMRLRAARRGREPDIFFVARENLERLGHQYLDGAADLAIEVVSPESVIRDRGEKYAEYEIEGVREYWILDVQAQRADFFVRDDTGRFQRVQPVEGVYRSTILTGFTLRESWLWQRPLPKVRDVLREIIPR